MSEIHTYLCFKDDKLISIIQSVSNNMKEALDYTHFVLDPQDSEEQIKSWKKRNKK